MALAFVRHRSSLVLFYAQESVAVVSLATGTGRCRLRGREEGGQEAREASQKGGSIAGGRTEAAAIARLAAFGTRASLSSGGAPSRRERVCVLAALRVGANSESEQTSRRRESKVEKKSRVDWISRVREDSSSSSQLLKNETKKRENPQKIEFTCKRKKEKKKAVRCLAQL